MYTHSIAKSAAIVYEKPDFSSQSVDELLYGMSLKLLGEARDFYEIESFYGYRGFVEKTAVVKQNDGMSEFMICVPHADLLYTPEYRLAPAITLPLGSRLSVVENGESDKFIKVKAAGGEYYTHKRNLKKYCRPKPEHLRDVLTDSAKLYLGAQYRWGGKSPDGIDCSGLCFMAYYLNGILIYRDAKPERSECMKQISKEEMKRGDLLFFPGHVAMYIGGGDFIHSTAAYGGVAINSFLPESSRYSKYHADTLYAITTLNITKK